MRFIIIDPHSHLIYEDDILNPSLVGMKADDWGYRSTLYYTPAEWKDSDFVWRKVNLEPVLIQGPERYCGKGVAYLRTPSLTPTYVHATISWRKRRIDDCPECGHIFSMTEEECPECGFDPVNNREDALKYEEHKRK